MNRLLEEFGYIRLGHGIQKAFGEDLEIGEVLDDMLDLFFRYAVVGVGHNEAGRCHEHGQVFVQRAVAHFQQDVDELVHAVLQLLFVFGGDKEVDGLYTDGVNRMVVAAEAFSLHEVVQALAVVGKQGINAYVHLRKVQTGGHLIEGRHASVQVAVGQESVAVGHQFRQLVVQANLVLEGDGRIGGVRREYEINEPFEGRILVDDVPKFMADDKAQLVLAHEVEHGGVDVHDVRLAIFLGRYGKGIERAVTGDVEVHLFRKVQALLDFLAESVEFRKDFLVHLHAVAFHAAAPVVVSGAVLRSFEDGFHHWPLQGLVDLFSEFPLQREGGVEGGHRGKV